MIRMCRELETASLERGVESPLVVVRALRQFRVALVKQDMAQAKQTTLDGWFGQVL
jgi:hypothetical protein